MQIIFYHLFYRIYWWNIKVIKEKDFPVLSAYLFVSTAMGINLISLITLFFVFVIENPKASFPGEVWITILLIFLPNYFIFIHKKKFKDIIKNSDNLEKIQKRKRDFAIFIYLILTILILIFVVNANQDLMFRKGIIIE